MAERLRCVVERITYQNAENGYCSVRYRMECALFSLETWISFRALEREMY